MTLPADQRVPAGLTLQFDETIDCGLGGEAVRMEVRRAVIALDDCDRAAWLELTFQNRQCLERLRKMLEDETDKNVVERPGFERQVEDVCLPELHIGHSSALYRLPGRADRFSGQIDRGELSIGASPCQGDRLRADPASDLEHPAATGVCSVRVEQLYQRACLIL